MTLFQVDAQTKTLYLQADGWDWLHHAQDNILGPWQSGRDPLEEALHVYEGVPGGPHVHPWEAGQRYGRGYALGDSGDSPGRRK